MFEFLVRFVDKLRLINQLEEKVDAIAILYCFIWLSNLAVLGFI